LEKFKKFKKFRQDDADKLKEQKITTVKLLGTDPMFGMYGSPISANIEHLEAEWGGYFFRWFAISNQSTLKTIKIKKCIHLFWKFEYFKFPKLRTLWFNDGKLHKTLDEDDIPDYVYEGMPMLTKTDLDTSLNVTNKVTEMVKKEYLPRFYKMIHCNRTRLKLCTAYMFYMKKYQIDKHLLRFVCDRLIHGSSWESWEKTTEFRENPQQETIHAGKSRYFKKVYSAHQSACRAKTQVLLKERVIKREREKLQNDEEQLEKVQKQYKKRQKKLKGLLGQTLIK